MKKILQRLLIFFIGLPLILVLVLFLPHYRHLVLNLIVLVFTALGALELSDMLAKKDLIISRLEAVVLGALTPAAMIAVVNFGLDERIVPACFAAGLFWTLSSRIFCKAEKQDQYIKRLAAGLCVLMYPGLFISWLVRMGSWNGVIILVFLLISIINDSAAWAAGMLFGRGNRGIIPVSPNKSIAGFIGGAFGSIVISAGAVVLLPAIFIPRFTFMPGSIPALSAGIALGLLTGLAAALGDLCESAIKRSAGCKDSGNLMPGRGGVLDSIDSIAMAAPVFYLVFSFLFIQI